MIRAEEGADPSRRRSAAGAHSVLSLSSALCLLVLLPASYLQAGLIYSHLSRFCFPGMKAWPWVPRPPGVNQ